MSDSSPPARSPSTTPSVSSSGTEEHERHKLESLAELRKQEVVHELNENTKLFNENEQLKKNNETLRLENDALKRRIDELEKEAKVKDDLLLVERGKSLAVMEKYCRLLEKQSGRGGEEGTSAESETALPPSKKGRMDDAP